MNHSRLGRLRILPALCLLAITTPLAQKASAEDRSQKPRIIVTTDLGADPDDEQSMVRLLVCANEFDIEGLIVSTGCWKKSQSNTRMLDNLVDAYAKCIDKDDPRPVWVGCWGGANNVAQAIWKVRKTRSKDELSEFLSKLRVFDILGQDDAGAWIAKNFPEVVFIRATGVYGWQPPKNGDYQRNEIQSHGPLGAAYPDTKWATEGDTPAFMHVYPNGLNDPEKIDQGGWGGRFSLKKKAGIRSMKPVTNESEFDPYLMYTNTEEGAKAIKRWETAYNNDFAARMDWSVTNDYTAANHHPVAVVDGDSSRKVLEFTVTAGESVRLDASRSSDPDKDSLKYTWLLYKEPSTWKETVSIDGASSAIASVSVPDGASGKELHIILEVRDDGTPSLYAYRRVILKAK